MIIAFVISCSSGQNKVQDIDKNYCQNMTALFAPSDTSNRYLINDSNILKFTTNQFRKGDNCDKDYFGLRLRNKFIIKIHKTLEKESSCLPKISAIQIMLNQSGQLAFNRNIIAIDSIKFWLHRKFPKENDFDLNEISLVLTKSVPKDSLDKVLLKIIEGYTSIYSDLAKDNFDKDICALSQTEINNLITKKPFRIVLKNTIEHLYPN